MTPRRLTTLQCSQIGLTLLRTFKTALKKVQDKTLNVVHDSSWRKPR
jgi:hypothetical protein